MIELSIRYLVSIILSLIIVAVEVNTDKDIKDLGYKEKLDLICANQKYINLSYLDICFIPILNSILVIAYTLELFRRLIQVVYLSNKRR